MSGDTVYCLDKLDLPLIVGIGDIGKMGRKDDISKGSPITMKAVEFILERSGYHAGSQGRENPGLSKSSQNEAYFKNRVGMGTSYDVGVRKLNILDKEIQLYYLNGLSDTAYIIHLMRACRH